jgi:hypothetical protein
MDMKDINLSIPAFYLSMNLVIVVVLFITSLWIRQTDLGVGEPQGFALPTGRGVGYAPAAAGGNRYRAPWRSSAWQPQRDRRPFRDLQATLSASYAAKVERAIQTIRIGAPAGTRPTARAAW